MASKLLGLGTVVKVDEDDGGSGFTTVTLVVDCKPPAKRRVKIPAIALADTLATYMGGIEDFSEFEFTHYWDPTDTQHVSSDTLFALGSATAGKVLWNIVYSNNVTESFEGWLSDLEAETIVVDGI